MWTFESKKIFQAGALVLAFGLSGIALAQPPAEAPAAAGRQGLRESIETRYRVLPIRNGVVLTPRQERLGVQTIEISGDTIAINGERVSDGVVRAWLAEDAETILRLRGLPPRERQALFGLQTGGRGAVEEEETLAPSEPADEAATEAAAEEVIPDDEAGETEIPAEGEEAGPGVPTPPGAPEPPQAPGEEEAPRSTTGTSGSRVNFGGNITVEKDELAEEAVAIMGSVRVDGEVTRDVQAIAGSVTVNGLVGGDVTAVGGHVRLGPNAVVDGDVTSVGGNVIRAEGAKVHGKTAEVGMAPENGRWENDLRFHPWSPFVGDSLDLAWQLVGLVVLSLLVFLCILLARRPMERAEHFVATEPWRAGLVGFLAQLLFLPLLVALTVLLAITVVGCVLFVLYPFLFIGIALAALLGYAAVAHRVGRFLEARFGWNFGPAPYAAALMGVLAIEVWSLIGRVMGLGGGVLDFLAFTILAFGFVVQYVAWTVGIGAVLLARFDSSARRQAAFYPGPLPPPPAPLPDLPPDPGPAVEEPSLAPERPWDPLPPASPAPPEPER
jgi:hypothetical protein